MKSYSMPIKKIAVIGDGFGNDTKILQKARELGSEIAEKGIELYTGGCRGYPYESVKGALEQKGKVLAISPAKNKDEHIGVYDFPIAHGIEIIYTGLGIPGRNLELIRRVEALIVIGGKTGTLNEFTIAFHEGKPIGVLTNSGGITEIIKIIVDKIKKTNKEIVVYSNKPKELINKLLD